MQTIEFVSLAALDALGDSENFTEAQRDARMTEWLQREITRFNTAGLRVTLGGMLESENAVVLLSEPATGVEQRFTMTSPCEDADAWYAMSEEEHSAHVITTTKSAVERWNAEGYHVDCMFSMQAGGKAVLMFLCTKTKA